MGVGADLLLIHLAILRSRREHKQTQEEIQTLNQALDLISGHGYRRNPAEATMILNNLKTSEIKLIRKHAHLIHDLALEHNWLSSDGPQPKREEIDILRYNLKQDYNTRSRFTWAIPLFILLFLGPVIIYLIFFFFSIEF